MEKMIIDLKTVFLQMITSYGEEIKKQMEGLKVCFDKRNDEIREDLRDIAEGLTEQKVMQNEKLGAGLGADGLGVDDKMDFGGFDLSGQKENWELEEEKMTEKDIYMDFDFPTGEWKFLSGFISLDYKGAEAWNIKDIKRMLGYSEGVFRAVQEWRQQDLRKVMDRQNYWSIKVKKKKKRKRKEEESRD